VFPQRSVNETLVVAAAGLGHLIAEPSDYFLIQTNRDFSFSLLEWAPSVRASLLKSHIHVSCVFLIHPPLIRRRLAR
jgi:hypothetical protein